MNEQSYSKGIIFGLISLIFVSLQPIVANSRPSVIDAYIFAAMTVIIEAIIFLPINLLERRKINQQEELRVGDGLKKHKYLLIYIGIHFGIAQILFFVAYELAGVINGALAAQTSIIFALLFGYLINKEKITVSQILFSCLLFFGLFLAITQGSFNLIALNLGVFIMLITTALWMIGHTVMKPILDKEEVTPTQLVFIRNTVSGIFLMSTYFIFYPISNVKLFLSPLNWLFFLAIGILYSIDLFYWYKSISQIDVSKATIIVSPLPILAAFFAFIFLGEIFTIFHLIGSLIVIFSIIMIVRQKSAKD